MGGLRDTDGHDVHLVVIDSSGAGWWFFQLLGGTNNSKGYSSASGEKYFPTPSVYVECCTAVSWG